MAYKVFTNGSVLNASEINDNLMNQSVMVFSNSTARAAALTSPVEGMLTWLEDSNKYQNYNGSAWVDLGSGKILQVVSATKTDVFSAAVGSAGTYSTDAFTISITPSSTASKVFITGVINMGSAAGNNVVMGALFRNGTIVLRGDAAGSRTRTYLGRVTTGDPTSITPAGFAILDDPNTTSAITYSIRLAPDQSSTVYLNRGAGDPDASFGFRSASSMVAMEVSA